MKKSVFLLVSLILFSCKKEVNIREKVNDSNKVSKIIPEKIERDSPNIVQDSLNNTNTNKSITVSQQNGEIVKILDGEKLPCTVEQEFNKKIQKLILKIPHYNKQNIKAQIVPQNNNMNVRFNQIRTPDGKFDGPFGREISYQLNKNGEVWLIIGKNLMAEGDIEGAFSVTLE